MADRPVAVDVIRGQRRRAALARVDGLVGAAWAVARHTDATAALGRPIRHAVGAVGAA